MTEGKSQKEAALHKFSDEGSDYSHSKGTELDNDQTEDKHFYKEDRDTPAHLTGKLRKDYEEPRSKIRVERELASVCSPPKSKWRKY